MALFYGSSPSINVFGLNESGIIPGRHQRVVTSTYLFPSWGNGDELVCDSIIRQLWTAYKEAMDVAALSVSYLTPQLSHFCKTPRGGLVCIGSLYNAVDIGDSCYNGSISQWG